MSTADQASSAAAGSGPSWGRGRGKSRGGLGKYLRARGRGHGRGRGAVWGQRLVLEGEQETELDPEEQEEFERKYSRRQLGTNADRYAEPEPELDSDGEEVVEPEVDLSTFLERQRLSEAPPPTLSPPDENEGVDISLAHFLPRSQSNITSKKGQVQQIEWDDELERLRAEKAAAEATRDLKTRFRAQAAKQRGKPSMRGGGVGRTKGSDRNYVEAPPLPTDEPKLGKTEKAGMEDFLDELLG